jgi:hypothetical protein
MQARFHDVVSDSVEQLFAEGVLPFVDPPKYAERASVPITNYQDTDWYALFRRLEVGLGDDGNDIGRDGKLFRRRFRLPFSEFYDIYQTVSDEEWFGEERQSKRRPPLFMKIMGVFRLLGRNLVYDDITEIAKIKEETMRVFFLQFVRDFSRRFYDEWMRQPQTTEDIFANERVYRSNGFVFQFLQVISVTELIILTGCQAAATRSTGSTCAGNVAQQRGIQNSTARKVARQSCIRLS